MYKVYLCLYTDSTLLHPEGVVDWRISLIPREGEIINHNGLGYKVHSIVYMHTDNVTTSQIYINAHLPNAVKQYGFPI